MNYKENEKFDLFIATSYMVYPLIIAFFVIIAIQTNKPELVDIKYINLITIATIGFTICELIKSSILFYEAKIDLSKAQNEEGLRRMGFRKKDAEIDAVHGNYYMSGTKDTHKLANANLKFFKALVISVYVIVLTVFIIFPFIEERISDSEYLNNILTSLSFLLFLVTIILNGRIQLKISKLSSIAINIRADIDRKLGGNE